MTYRERLESQVGFRERLVRDLFKLCDERVLEQARDRHYSLTVMDIVAATEAVKAHYLAQYSASDMADIVDNLERLQKKWDAEDKEDE